MAPLIRNILHKEGLRGIFFTCCPASKTVGLYRGFAAFAVGSFPGQLSYLLTYEYMNEKLRSSMPTTRFFNKDLTANALAGMTAEAASVFSFLPADVISQRLQIQTRYNFLPSKYQNTRPFPIVQKILQSEGLSGFFRGLVPYLIVFGPGSAVWWMSYEWTKSLLSPILPTTLSATRTSPKDHMFKASSHLICGSLAGVASVLVTNPLDVARTRLQLYEVSRAEDRKFIRGGFLSVLKDAFRNEGIAGLYKGVRPRILIKIPGSALAFLGYEYLKDFVAIN